MRGIERVVTGILLAAAVCGSAAFARSVGRETAGSGGKLELVATPPQAAPSPRAVQVPLYPLLTDRETSEPAVTGASKPSLRRVVVAKPIVRWHTPSATHAAVAGAGAHRRTARPAPVAHAHVPRAASAGTRPAERNEAAPRTPTRPSGWRILAQVRHTSAPRWGHVKDGPGRLKNRPDDDGPVAPAQQPPSSPPTTQSASPTVTIVVLDPGPQRGSDNGNGHGHAYGRLKQGLDDHD